MGVTSRRQGKQEGRETALLEAQLEPAPASQRSRKPRCRELSEGNGVLGRADTGSQSCPYLASSHPLCRTGDRSNHLVPPSFLLTRFWGPSCGGDRQGEGANINSVCAGDQAGFGWAVQSRDKRRRPQPIVGKEVHASRLWDCRGLGAPSP